MQLTIPPAKASIQAKITIPGSKSITNRALLLAALAQGDSFLENVLFSEDTLALMYALRHMGITLDIDTLQHTVRVKGGAGQFLPAAAAIDCRDAATVARFLLAVCANQTATFRLEGNQRLRQRPLSDLVRVLRLQGASISATSLPLIINNQHRLRGGPIFVPGNMSSQFLSGLLITAPFCQADVKLFTKNLVSAPYVDMTCAMMRDFGVEVLPQQQSWSIKVGQQYQARPYFIESDFSSASYFFAAAAVTAGTITLKNMTRNNSLQGDSAFLTVLEKMGCAVTVSAQGITVRGPERLKGVTQNMRHISDTMMTLAAIAPFAETPTHITHIGNTRLKESDRITAMANNLRLLGVHVIAKKTALTIYPSKPHAAMIRCYQDHRIAMACALIGLKVPGVIIDDTTCVNKTFPEFFEIFTSLCQ